MSNKYKRISEIEFLTIAEEHCRWLATRGTEGKRANLSGVDLIALESVLARRDLRRADLSYSNIGADASDVLRFLYRFDIRGADTYGALLPHGAYYLPFQMKNYNVLTFITMDNRGDKESFAPILINDLDLRLDEFLNDNAEFLLPKLGGDTNLLLLRAGIVSYISSRGLIKKRKLNELDYLFRVDSEYVSNINEL